MPILDYDHDDPNIQLVWNLNDIPDTIPSSANKGQFNGAFNRGAALATNEQCPGFDEYDPEQPINTGTDIQTVQYFMDASFAKTMLWMMIILMVKWLLMFISLVMRNRLRKASLARQERNQVTLLLMLVKGLCQCKKTLLKGK